MSGNSAAIFDDRVCTLGEGAFWHPLRQQFFWFDIIGKRLLSRSNDGETLQWQFDEHASAAGWIDNNTLLIASETALLQFDIASGKQQTLCALEADNPVTRSNDGRADPWGGFWIGTMGKAAEAGAGAIYRYYLGELRKLVAPVTIPNAICFSPDRQFNYFADTTRGKIWRQPLDGETGWPAGEPTLFIDCQKEGVNPDGAVVDSEGRLWNAQWGASRVAQYNANGEFLSSIAFPAQQISCPAFGGSDLQTLFATSATENLGKAELATQPDAGKTFCVSTGTTGQAEHQLIL